MKIIKISKGKQVLVDDEDFDYLSQWKWMYNTRGYAVRGIRMANGKTGKISMHRLITKASPGVVVDHINGDKLDNRKNNLRFCTQQQNTWNSKINKRNLSGHKNVFWVKSVNKWRVQVQGRSYGYFREINDAIIIASKIRNKLYGEFAKNE